MIFDRKHQKNNIFVLFHPHFPRVNKLSIWPLEAGNALAVVKDVTYLIQREPFLQVVFHRVIGPQIFTLNEVQGAFPIKLLKYNADEINVYRKQ